MSARQEYIKQYRKYLKDHHMCRDCCKQDAYTLAGRTYCFECAEKAARKRREAWLDPNKKAKMNASNRAVKKRHKERHECIACGRPLPHDYAKATCEYCLALSREKSRQKRISKGVNWPRGDNGICWQCNKRSVNETLGNGKLCTECYNAKVAYIMPNLEKAQRNNPWKGHWYYEPN